MASRRNENQRFPFTKTKLAALPIPREGRAVYHDTTTPGLILRITPAGQRSFCFYRKVDGRPTRLLVGKFPQTTVEQARKACNRLSGAVVEGKNPAAERQAKRGELTFLDLWEHWRAYAEPRKRSFVEDARMFRLFLSRWGTRRLSTIKKADVQALHHRVGLESGRYRANRLHELVRAMFNRAADIGYSGGNPAAGVKRFPEERRDRFLHGDELRRFFEALAAEPPLIRDFFLLCLLTAARQGNVMGMAWDQLDLDNRLWRIPTTKSGIPVVVPLTEAALAVLESRHQAADGAEWVFPSSGKTGHLVEAKTAWKRIITRAGLVDVRPHDLRRSLGSWMAMIGTGLPIVGKMLGHTQSRTTEIYARLSVDPVRQAAEKATSAMLEAGGVKLLSNGWEQGQANQ